MPFTSLLPKLTWRFLIACASSGVNVAQMGACRFCAVCMQRFGSVAGMARFVREGMWRFGFVIGNWAKSNMVRGIAEPEVVRGTVASGGALANDGNVPGNVTAVGIE